MGGRTTAAPLPGAREDRRANKKARRYRVKIEKGNERGDEGVSTVAELLAMKKSGKRKATAYEEDAVTRPRWQKPLPGWGRVVQKKIKKQG